MIIVAIISIPFWPKPYLTYGIYIPSFITLVWLICDGCPISQYQPELNGESFILSLAKNVYPSMTEHKIQNILTAFLTIATLVSVLRLKN